MRRTEWQRRCESSTNLNQIEADVQDEPKRDHLKSLLAPAMIWIGRLPLAKEPVKISMISILGAAVVGGYLGKWLSSYGHAAIDMRIVGATGAGASAMIARIIRSRG